MPLFVLLVIALALPATLGAAADPAMNPDVIAEAANDSVTPKIDGLMIALAYVLFIMTVGGAF